MRRAGARSRLYKASTSSSFIARITIAVPIIGSGMPHPHHHLFRTGVALTISSRRCCGPCMLARGYRGGGINLPAVGGLSTDADGHFATIACFNEQLKTRSAFSSKPVDHCCDKIIVIVQPTPEKCFRCVLVQFCKKLTFPLFTQSHCSQPARDAVVKLAR
jgi:hypothetical protein